MSLDTDYSEHQTMENAPDKHLFSGEPNLIPCQSGSRSGKLHFPEAGELGSGEGSILKPETVSEVSPEISLL